MMYLAWPVKMDNTFNKHDNGVQKKTWVNIKILLK
jgi:hypothetical protein